MTRYPCEGCGRPREMAGIRWCAACVRKLYEVIRRDDGMTLRLKP